MSDDEKRGPGRPATGETPRFKIGCPRPLWNAMIAAAEPAGGLSAVTRAFYAWYTAQPGAEAPHRPSALPAPAAVCTCDTDPRGCVVHGPSARAADR